MILGLALKNYKVYKTTQYIPISYGSNFSAFLGPNGVGKTSIFEALDRFFQGGEWISNNESKKNLDNEGFLAPLFLIPIDSINLSKRDRALAAHLSDFFWHFSGSAYSKFIETIKNTTASLSASGFSAASHYLFMLGSVYQADELRIPFFEQDIKKHFETISEFEFSDLTELLKKVKSYYRYIYLPVEADSVSFTNMESTFIQKLLDEDIRKKIQDAIGSESLKTINTSLKSFVDEINKNLDSYNYQGKWKDRLTANDLIDRIFSAYFGVKVLSKKQDGKDTAIRNLSSGEKRRAVIDLSYALISKSKQRKYQIIFAIDEPDASMHVSACHDQFEKIAKIPGLCDPSPQMLINTHWYGFIPVMRDGIAHSLSKGDDQIDFFSFNLENFREHINQKVSSTKGVSPKEVELKSYQDMIQSVVSSMLHEKPYSWIFCEGLSDKIYLSHYLSDLLDEARLRIVPLGGFKQVRRVYSYLAAPLSDKEAGFKGKALCLVDTDSQTERPIVQKDLKALYFLRIVRDESKQEVVAVDADEQKSYPTEIEFALREEVFINLMESPASSASLKDFSVLQGVVENANVCSGSNNLYDYLNLGPKEKKLVMEKFFDIGDNKVEFAKAYISCDQNKSYEPKWIATLRSKLTGKSAVLKP